MKQVRLQLTYSHPVVIACLVPPRPSSALSSPDALRKFETDQTRHANAHPFVCVPSLRRLRKRCLFGSRFTLISRARPLSFSR